MFCPLLQHKACNNKQKGTVWPICLQLSGISMICLQLSGISSWCLTFASMHLAPDPQFLKVNISPNIVCLLYTGITWVQVDECSK